MNEQANEQKDAADRLEKGFCSQAFLASWRGEKIVHTDPVPAVLSAPVQHTARHPLVPGPPGGLL